MTTPASHRAVDDELAKLARKITNIRAACDNGQISKYDRNERIARAEQWTENRVAYLTGEERPVQRQQKPLYRTNVQSFDLGYRL